MRRRELWGPRWRLWGWTHYPVFHRLDVLGTPWFGILVNHMDDHEPDSHGHTHLHSFLSVMLRRNYDEDELVDGEWVPVPRRRIRLRRAGRLHRTTPDAGGCWSLCVRGPNLRRHMDDWGVQAPGEEFVRMRDIPRRFPERGIEARTVERA